MAFENSLKGSTVYVRNDNVEQAIRKLKKKMQDSGLLQELRDREAYEKPTTKRRKNKNQQIRRAQKKREAEALPKKMY